MAPSDWCSPKSIIYSRIKSIIELNVHIFPTSKRWRVCWKNPSTVSSGTVINLTDAKWVKKGPRAQTTNNGWNVLGILARPQTNAEQTKGKSSDLLGIFLWWKSFWCPNKSHSQMLLKKNKQTSDNLSAFRWRRLVEPTVLLKPQLSLAITTADSIHFRVSSSDYQIVKCGKRGNCATVAIYAHVHWQVALAGHRNSITSWAKPMPFHAASDWITAKYILHSEWTRAFQEIYWL